MLFSVVCGIHQSGHDINRRVRCLLSGREVWLLRGLLVYVVLLECTDGRRGCILHSVRGHTRRCQMQ